MRCVSVLLAVLTALQCAHSFVLHQTPIVGRSPAAASSAVVARGRAGRGEATSPTMCVPKEVAAAILVVGAGYIITQGVPPAKAEDVVSMSDTPTTCIVREAVNAKKMDQELELALYALQAKPAVSEDSITKALLSEDA